MPTNQTSTDLVKTLQKFTKEKKAKAISTTELIYKLAELSEGNYTKGYMVTVTEPKMNKTGNELFGRVKKMSGWGFDANADYSRKVNLQREREEKEADFVALPSWAEAINKVVYRHATKQEQLYMSVFPTKNFGSFVTYFVDGKVATAEQIAIIKQFTPDKSDSSRQGTEKKIEIRRPKIESICSISIAGSRYKLSENILQHAE